MHAKRKRNVGKHVPATMLQIQVPMPTSNNAGEPRTARFSQSRHQRTLPSTTRNQEDTGRTLDGFMLLDCCRVAFPDEVSQAVLSGLNVTNVVAEDLFFFTHLARLDLSDNEAPFEPFGGLPRLQELDFQCNALQQITIPANSFSSLEVLNLSFNCLTTCDVEELSKLLRIRELYLGNNLIRALPPVMDRFSKLETLSLEHNSLTDSQVFNLLAIMPRLRNLNLSNNKLTAFPESALTIDGKRGAGLYNLAYLNLAHNRIAQEDDVLATGELRSLRKLVLYGNPLAHTAVSSHDPTKLNYDPIPTLTDYLAQTERDVVVLVSYPDTKKKRNAAGTYDNIEIYKMLPNSVPLPSPFRTKSTAQRAEEAEEMKPNEHRPPRTKQLVVDTSDTTFLTGVGIEDVLTHDASQLPEILPVVPASVITRSLEGHRETNPIKVRAAINALRYQLQHPLTSHDDADVSRSSFQRPTQAQLHRQLPRHPLQPERRRSQDTASSPPQKAFTSTPALFRPLEGSKAIDDALTQLSYQVARSWDKQPHRHSTTGVDTALESLENTAQKVSLVFRSPS